MLAPDGIPIAFADGQLGDVGATRANRSKRANCSKRFCRVLKVEVGGPGDFAKRGSKEAIVQKLEEKAGPEARKLFETFMRDVEKLQQEQKGG